MTFNKWSPLDPEPPRRGLSPEARAWAMRGAWYVSLLMLVLGYVLLFVYWGR